MVVMVIIVAMITMHTKVTIIKMVIMDATDIMVVMVVIIMVVMVGSRRLESPPGDLGLGAQIAAWPKRKSESTREKKTWRNWLKNPGSRRGLVTGLRLFPKFYHFFVASLTRNAIQEYLMKDMVYGNITQNSVPSKGWMWCVLIPWGQTACIFLSSSQNENIRRGPNIIISTYPVSFFEQFCFFRHILNTP